MAGRRSDRHRRLREAAEYFDGLVGFRQAREKARTEID
jgi:hypothetical protein